VFFGRGFLRMATDHVESILVVEAKPMTRGELVSTIVAFGFLTAVCLVLAVAAVLQEAPKGPGHAAGAALVGLLLVGVWPAVGVYSVRATPRGTWTLDADGVVFRPTRGAPRSVRWKDVERVRWTRRAYAALWDGRTNLRFPLSLIGEPARTTLHERLEAVLGSDFDLAFRRMPDLLDEVEPGWWNLTLRVGRLLAVSLPLAAAMMGSLYWVAVRYPARGAWQGQAAFFGWYLLGIGYLLYVLRRENRRNPTWRRRLGKAAAEDLRELP
jgi:hypothetical protein